jgi:YggT family protein
MYSPSSLILVLIQLYTLLVFARIVMSWFPVAPGSPWEPVYSFVFSATEPPLAAIRSVLPPLRMGMGAFDLSPLLLLFALQILAALVTR